ncbi:MAG: hypothetical protein MJK04_35775, partial [Psychrosphaera sp.]|nr:hypothetical protein [Psychrosphaera sp.]
MITIVKVIKPIMLLLVLLPTICLSSTSIRIVAANLTTGQQQNYDQGEGIAILKQIKADITLIQEFNFHQSTPEDISKLTTEVCGENCSV